jgi:hypothetical protein
LVWSTTNWIGSGTGTGVGVGPDNGESCGPASDVSADNDEDCSPALGDAVLQPITRTLNTAKGTSRRTKRIRSISLSLRRPPTAKPEPPHDSDQDNADHDSGQRDVQKQRT